MRFRRGDVVMQSQPFAQAVDESLFKSVCSGCLTELPSLSACVGCRHLRYCSKRCQKSDWAGHRFECRIFAKFPADFLPNQYTRLLARCLRRAKTDPDASEQIFGVRRTISSLMIHDEAKNDTDVMEFFGERYLEIRSYYKKELVGYTSDSILDMFLRIWINCQSLGDEQPLAVALYLGQSAIDHSCARDHRYAHFYHGSTFVILALEDAELSFDDIRMPYCNLLQPRHQRQAELSRWYFTCACAVCSGQLPEIITLADFRHGGHSDKDNGYDAGSPGHDTVQQPSLAATAAAVAAAENRLSEISAQLRTTSDPVSVLKAAIGCEPVVHDPSRPAPEKGCGMAPTAIARCSVPAGRCSSADVHSLRDHTTLQSVWLLAFNALPSAGRHVEAIPYLRAILALVRRVYGTDGYYRQILTKVVNACEPSPDALALLDEERRTVLELNELFSLKAECDSNNNDSSDGISST